MSVAISREVSFDESTGEWCVVFGDEMIKWSLNGFLLDVRECVKQWATVCPENDREDMVEVLRDIADQIEHAWENDAADV